MPKTKNSDENVHYHLKWIVKSGFFVFLGVVLSKILLYTYRVIIARTYGVEDYGLFSLAIMITGFFSSIFLLGLSDGMIRYTAKLRGKEEIGKIKDLLKKVNIIISISSIFAGILLFLLAETISIKIFHNANLILYLKTFSITIPFYCISSIYLATIKGFEKMGWYSFIFNVLQNLIKVGVIAILIIVGLKTNAIIFSYVLSIIGMYIASYLICRYKIPELWIKYNKPKEKIIGNVLNYSWPFILVGMVNILFFWTDSFMIGYFKNVILVGIYNVAVPLSSLLSIAPELFIQVFLPLATKEISKNNIENVRKISEQVGKWIFLLNLPLFMLIFLFPGTMINLLFGKEYLAAETSLRILIVSGLFTTVAVISSGLLAAVGKSKTILSNLVITTIINIFLAIPLIINYGINGAAIATAFSGLLLAGLNVYQAYKYTKILPFKKEMIKIFLLSIIPTIMIFFLRKTVPLTYINVILLGLTFIISYFILLILAKCFDKNDIMIIKAIKKKIIG